MGCRPSTLLYSPSVLTHADLMHHSVESGHALGMLVSMKRGSGDAKKSLAYSPGKIGFENYESPPHKRPSPFDFQVLARILFQDNIVHITYAGDSYWAVPVILQTHHTYPNK